MRKPPRRIFIFINRKNPIDSKSVSTYSLCSNGDYEMTTTTITDILARWATEEGRPFKGELIDWDAYEHDGYHIGCMCAQGQVLHLVGGYGPEYLKDLEQYDADRECAALLNISRAHAVLLREINDSVDGAPSIVLTDPGAVIGDKWRTVLAFWMYINSMDEVALKAAWDAAWAAARDAAWAAARDAVGDAAWGAARDAAWVAAGVAAWNDVEGVASATNEIQGAEVLRREDKTFFFLPLFGFATPEDIPPLPADYGLEGFAR